MAEHEQSREPAVEQVETLDAVVRPPSPAEPGTRLRVRGGHEVAGVRAAAAPAVEQVETLEDWAAALLPTLVGVRDYEAQQRRKAEAARQGRWPAITENIVSIRFTDCDPFGHLNNGRYIDYFINGRDFHMESYYGLNLATHALKTHETYVVKSHQLAYIQPALLREEVLIRGILLDFGDDMTFVESQMLDAKGHSLKALMWSEFNYVNVKTKRRVRQPDWVLAILRQTVSESEHYRSRDFDGRIAEVQRGLRRARRG